MQLKNLGEFKKAIGEVSILKSSLFVLIKAYGIEAINDKIAEIFNDYAEETNDTFYDDLSEYYDNINKDLKMKDD